MKIQNLLILVALLMIPFSLYTCQQRKPDFQPEKPRKISQKIVLNSTDSVEAYKVEIVEIAQLQNGSSFDDPVINVSTILPPSPGNEDISYDCCYWHFECCELYSIGLDDLVDTVVSKIKVLMVLESPEYFQN